MPKSPEGGETAVERLSRALEFYSAQAGGKATTAIVSTADLRLAIEALSAPQPPTAGEGWKLVPVEPTEAMVMAGYRAYGEDGFYSPGSTYRAQLAASPSPTAGPSRGKGE